jgi:hypothetical protein
VSNFGSSREGTRLASLPGVNIRFTSSLTPEDENAIAPALLHALSGLLDLLPIAYSIRIDTSDAQVFQHSGLGKALEAAAEPIRSRPVATLAR